MLKIASWNVNSLKMRLDQVLSWIETTEVDVLALQETKTIDPNFPLQVFQTLGFHVAYSGQPSYNGMAIISRTPLHDIVTDIPEFLDPQRRILAVTVNNMRVINLYVPNGSTVNSEKYIYKLNWLEQVTQYIQDEMKKYAHVVVVGDFNIAPNDCDVHDPEEWIGSVLVSPAERAALKNILDLGFHDSFRQLNPTDPQYSWWDYRAASYRRNRGLRIDLILLNQNLMTKCVESSIDSGPRQHAQPSDHAPVLVSLQMES
ncbi:MAG: exodeoxyribonuclease III [Legionellaceae bacterium]|nr:exodeoxyribonuclease III [Legionellaceae bacterium]